MAGFVVLSELSLQSQRGLPREPVLEGNFVAPAFVLTQGEVDRVYVAELHPDAVGGTFESGAPKRELLLVQLLEEVDVFAATDKHPETWFPARFLNQRGPMIWKSDSRRFAQYQCRPRKDLANLFCYVGV